jgi:hypothetical protein
MAIRKASIGIINWETDGSATLDVLSLPGARLDSLRCGRQTLTPGEDYEHTEDGLVQRIRMKNSAFQKSDVFAVIEFNTQRENPGFRALLPAILPAAIAALASIVAAVLSYTGAASKEELSQFRSIANSLGCEAHTTTKATCFEQTHTSLKVRANDLRATADRFEAIAAHIQHEREQFRVLVVEIGRKCAPDEPDVKCLGAIGTERDALVTALGCKLGDLSEQACLDAKIAQSKVSQPMMTMTGIQ